MGQTSNPSISMEEKDVYKINEDDDDGLMMMMMEST